MYDWLVQLSYWLIGESEVPLIVLGGMEAGFGMLGTTIILSMLLSFVVRKIVKPGTLAWCRR